MKSISYIIMIAILALACQSEKEPKNKNYNFSTVQDPKTIDLDYPKTSSEVVSDTYFGTTIEDPYRWLEDDLSEETGAWVKKQNKVTQSYLSQIGFRKSVRDRISKIYDFEKMGSPFKYGAYTYMFKNNGLQNQYVLYRSKDGKEEVFLDPNTFSEDGTSSLAGINFSKDGSLAVYKVSEGGSDWSKGQVIETAGKTTKKETIDNLKFTRMTWVGNEGFYYSSYPTPDGSKLSAKTTNHLVYYHTIGTDQKEDKVVFGDQKDQVFRYTSAQVSENQKYLIINAATSTSGNKVFIKEVGSNDAFKEVLPMVEYDCSLVTSKADILYFYTNYEAPNGRLVMVDAKDPSYKNWKDVIPETQHTLEVSAGAGYLFANYLVDALSMVQQYDYDGNKVRDIKLPGIGSANGFRGKTEDTTIYYSFSNYHTPNSIFELNPSNGAVKKYWSPSLDIDPSQFESKQVFYTSKDGTKVPMTLTYKKGIELNGQNPTILYGYGGFNISLTPYYNSIMPAWMEQGGIYAVANLRGGGEYGKKWHVAGTKLQKQNVFDDFIAAAEYLFTENYTSSERLALLGGSNGGLLVGATMTQRPELAKVAIPMVGVLDMLRYHTFTSGEGWKYDYGTANESKEMFEYLRAYSPVHNVKPNAYPATMVCTGDHDDRVVPAHSFKFASHLQKNQEGELPTLIRINTNAGHGAGKPTSIIIDEWADILSFAMFNMGIKPSY